MNRIGSIVIIIKNRHKVAPFVNQILSDFGDIILARIGLPFKEKNINIINLIINGNTDDIGALTGKLGKIDGVSVRSILAKEE